MLVLFDFAQIAAVALVESIALDKKKLWVYGLSYIRTRRERLPPGNALRKNVFALRYRNGALIWRGMTLGDLIVISLADCPFLNVDN